MNSVKSGFALPTVIISSIVMLLVLLTGLTASSSITAALREQYYGTLVKEAAQSGAARVTACLKQNGNVTWSDNSPLRPNTSCSGGTACTGASNCSVLSSSAITTTFTVPSPEVGADGSTRFTIQADVQLHRTSNGSISRTISNSALAVFAPAMKWKQASSRGGSICGVSIANQLYCWGGNYGGQVGIGTRAISVYPAKIDLTPLKGGTLAKSLTTGQGNSACAIASTGAGYCWGNNNNGELGNGTPDGSNLPTPVSTTGALAGKTLNKLSTGGYGLTCAIASDNNAYCWGFGGQGGTGDGSGKSSNVPVAVSTAGVLSGKSLSAIDTNGSSACTVSSDGFAYCWGYNYRGQLGNGTNGSGTDSNVPVAVSTSGVLAGKTLKDVKTDINTFCALDTAGKAYCWGSNGNGVLGAAASTDSNVPVAVNTAGVLAGKTLTKLAMGGNTACALDTAGQAYCWGGNSRGQLGNGTTTDSNVPVAVNMTGVLSGKTLTAIAVGLGGTTCVLDTAGKAYCWGYGADGVLGNGSTADSLTPVAVDTSGALAGKTLTEIATTGYATCALATDGSGYCWGPNNGGPLGNADPSDSNIFIPRPVSTSGVLNGVSMSSVSAGSGTPCALDTAGKAYCWGPGTYGTLGNGTTTDSLVPVAVSTSGALAGKTLNAISAGGNTACALDTAGKAYCWGNNAYGQLGIGTTTNSSVPVAVSTSGVLSGKTLTSISTDGNTVCAIASDGTGYCWGYNSYGTAGNGTTTNQTLPVAVSTSGALSGKTLTSIAVNASTTCALDSTGKAYCWGYNYYGEIGNGNTTDSSVPVSVYASGVLSGKTLASIARGTYHTCAVDTAGAAYCWGNNSYGQLGDGTTTNSITPIALDPTRLNGDTVKSIIAGTYDTCVITTSSQRLMCIGNNNTGSFGNNTRSTTNTKLVGTNDPSNAPGVLLYF